MGYAGQYLAFHVVKDADAERVALVDADVGQVEAVLVQVDAVSVDVASGVDEVALQGVAAVDV